MKNSQKFDLRKFLNENKISTGTHKSKNLIVEDFKNLMPEAGGTQDDKYVHIGYGKYKEKGKEKDTNAPTFTKDDSGKYIPAGDSKDGGQDGGEEQPKVNIFDKPEPKKSPPPNKSGESNPNSTAAKKVRAGNSTKVKGTGGNVLYSDDTAKHMKLHNQVGEGSVWNDSGFETNIDDIIANIPKEFYENGGGIHTVKTKSPVGANLVQKSADILKKHPNAKKIQVKKMERGQEVLVDAYIVDAPTEEFQTNTANVIIRPSNADYMDDSVKSDKYVQRDLKNGKSFSVLTAFPGDPNVPASSEWGDSGHAIIIPNGGKDANKENWVDSTGDSNNP